MSLLASSLNVTLDRGSWLEVGKDVSDGSVSGRLPSSGEVVPSFVLKRESIGVSWAPETDGEAESLASAHPVAVVSSRYLSAPADKSSERDSRDTVVQPESLESSAALPSWEPSCLVSKLVRDSWRFTDLEKGSPSNHMRLRARHN